MATEARTAARRHTCRSLGEGGLWAAGRRHREIIQKTGVSMRNQNRTCHPDPAKRERGFCFSSDF